MHVKLKKILYSDRFTEGGGSNKDLKNKPALDSWLCSSLFITRIFSDVSDVVNSPFV